MELVYKSYVGGNSSDYYYEYFFIYLICAGNNKLFRVAPSTCSGYSVSGDQHWHQTVLGFLDFYFFVFISFPMCQSVCVSVGLFAIYFKFFKNSFL